MNKIAFLLAAALSAVPVSGLAQEQSYPNKPIKIIVPYAVGGGTDIAARLIGARIQEELGQSVIIENKPGASGSIGTDIVAKAAPDGYVLSMASGSTMTINPYMIKVPYDPVRDFAPVGMVTATVLALVVHPSVQARSVNELIAYLKMNPDGYSYSSPGSGTPHYLTAELFKSLTGTKMTHVPYKGSGQALNDLIGGQVQLAFDTISVVLPHVKAGRLRMIATTDAKRTADLPEVPTVAESGLPGFESFSWYGVVAPAGTPKPIIDKLNAAIRKGLENPDVLKRLDDLGATPVSGTPKQMGEFIHTETLKWVKVIKELGASVK